MASCARKTSRFLAVVKALISRALFVLHSLICIWGVVTVKGEYLYWTLGGTYPLLVIETFYTLRRKKNSEWKWMCPSVFLYLATSVPAIWFLELDVLHRRLAKARATKKGAADDDAAPDESHSGGLTRTVINQSSPEVFYTAAGGGEWIQEGGGLIHFPAKMDTAQWCSVLEQMLLLILIVGRWLLPKGEITKEQLSQLLLVYIGMAADIIELFEAFKEKKVRENSLLVMVILALWTASLVQFTLVVTASKSKKSRLAISRSPSPSSHTPRCGGKECLPAEVMAILISVFLQDAPFLVLRLMLIFRYDVLSYTNIFFTSKNSLVLILQIYRLLVLFTENKRKRTSHSDDDLVEVASSASFPSQKSSQATLPGLGGDGSTLSLDQPSFSDPESLRRKLYGKNYISATSNGVQHLLKQCRSEEQRQLGATRPQLARQVNTETLRTKSRNSSVDYSLARDSKNRPTKSKLQNRPAPSSAVVTKRKDSHAAPSSRLTSSVKPGKTSLATNPKQMQSKPTTAGKALASGKAKSVTSLSKPSGQSTAPGQPRTPTSGQKVAVRQEQTRGEPSPSVRGQGQVKPKVKAIGRQSKMPSTTSHPSDLSEGHRELKKSRLKFEPGHQKPPSATTSPKDRGRLQRQSQVARNEETRQPTTDEDIHSSSQDDKDRIDIGKCRSDIDLSNYR